MNKKVTGVGVVSLNDLPTNLRLLADKIERGDLAASRLIVVSYDDDQDWLGTFAYGKHPDGMSFIGLLHQAIMQIGLDWRLLDDMGSTGPRD